MYSPSYGVFSPQTPYKGVFFGNKVTKKHKLKLYFMSITALQQNKEEPKFLFFYKYSIINLPE